MEKIKNWFERNIVLISILIWVLTILLLLVGYREHLNVSFTIEPNLISSFGDFLSGFLGSTFGIITIYLVYKTYKSQKEELEASRTLIKIQKNDSTFFSMLDSFNNSKANLETINITDSKQYKGLYFFKRMRENHRDYFLEFDEQKFHNNFNKIEGKLFDFLMHHHGVAFKVKYLNNNLDTYQKLPSIERDKIKILAAAYKVYSSYYGHLFLHYFNTLNTILDYLNSIEKNALYSEILVAQLSQDELYHIYHYSLLSESFKENVKRHQILKRLTYIELVSAAVHTEFYAHDIALPEVPSILI
ncbi:putative phage abortive infection protein [Oscillatoria amoena NRMC-F 0135]|nr:putative phage abortive infection protein [Oscillatoria amoena NRMC-F 0135]